ncbi:MAG TPA: Rne/Rng family ribonuclease [Acidimicrobiia bacterium]|nr:Rne/Rng family ribonuclease [Acidimicrobiia bacterium]
MSDNTPTEARPASDEHDASGAPADGAGNPTESTKPTSGGGKSSSGSGSAAGGGGTPRRRRRRGSRGGRNRRKPKAAAAPAGAAAKDPADAGEDYTDAAADRGMTSEDVAADARVEAGLADAEPGTVTATEAPASAKPKIGDTRPAPASASSGDGTTTRKRRRRRGGRGRGRARSGDSGAAAPEAVQADLGAADAAVTLEELDDTALQRRRGRTRKGRPAGRYMMAVHVRDDRTTHIGVLEGRSLVEHYVGSLEPDDTAIDGNIYLGKVQNVLPGMEAAFVDIGTPKNGVLYRGDVAFDPNDVEESHPRIERLLKNGQSVLVQVTKNPIGAKGARLTQEVSLAGRFVVMVPGQPETYGISKRLPDDERKRLRRVLEGLRPPDAGLIVRTAAEGATDVELRRDVERLRAQWEQVSKVAARAKAPSLVYQEPTLVVRVIREEFTKEYRGVVIDDRDLYEQVRGYVDAIAPELAERVEYYDAEEEGLPLYERFHVQEQLLKALDRKVWLPSGGSLIVESTEALTVIDVNTGKNVGRTNLEETVYRNNLEAAEEVARQLRLRDIGGIIVIDFIDMEIRKNRDDVMRAFREALARDKTRTQVFDISELGLVEMTRKRISEGLVETFSQTCPTCQGRGFLVDESLLQ